LKPGCGFKARNREERIPSDIWEVFFEAMHIYSHVMPSMHQDAMGKLNEAIGENLLEERKLEPDKPDDEQKAS
jgi:hypothetical protein